MKDPAVLFYFQDFLVGTEFMNDDEVGKYIRILCHQADKGDLSLSQLERICRSKVPGAIMEKLTQNGDGKYYQERMRFEKEKREKFCKHQSENIKKRWNKKEYDGNTNVLPLENENINENKDIIKNIRKVQFEKFWNLYDKKEDRIKCEGKWNRLTNKEQEECIANLPAYITSTPDKQYRKNPATYLNNKSWENEIIIPTNKAALNSTLTYDEILKMSEKNPDIWKQYTSVKREGERKAVFILKT